MKRLPSFGLIPRVTLLLTIVLHPTTGQTKSSASGATQNAEKTAMLLVDTDDACRLTVDDQDEGLITPAQSKKIRVSLGDHIVKCVVEQIPDLMWRKVVQVKGSDQVVAMVALKALHIQYNQAAGRVQQQKEKATAPVDKQKTDEAEFPERVFGQLRGVWRSSDTWQLKDEDPNDKPTSIDDERTLEFQSLNGQVITTQLTRDTSTDPIENKQHKVDSLSFQITSPNLLTGVGVVRCLVFTSSNYKSSGKLKGQWVLHNGVCDVEQEKVEIKLLYSNRLQLTIHYPDGPPKSLVFVKSF